MKEQTHAVKNWGWIKMKASNIKDRLQQAKVEEADVKKQITDGFLTSIQKLMLDFGKKVNNKQIEIKDPNDLYKLFVIFSQMSTIDNSDSSGGVLPQISTHQQTVFNDIVSEGRDGESIVDLEKLSELSSDDLAQMIADKEKTMNEENSETF